MSAPSYVPVPPAATVHAYESSPWLMDGWEFHRPGEIERRQPLGARLGVPGPDPGYVLLLVERFRDRLVLGPGEHEADAIAGCVAVALKRTGLMGRAPVIHDLTVAFTIWRFIGPEAPEELLALRGPMFEECHDAHDYQRRRRIADAVPAVVLQQPVQRILDAAEADWRNVLDL